MGTRKKDAMSSNGVMDRSQVFFAVSCNTRPWKRTEKFAAVLRSLLQGDSTDAIDMHVYTLHAIMVILLLNKDSNHYFGTLWLDVC